MRRSGLAAAAAAMAFASLAPAPVLARAAAPAVRMLRTVPLTIATAHGVRRFRVEVAASDAEQERGLMYRTSVRPGTGMIFPMTPPRVATFWMKNTLVPLDMIFIRADGTIARVAANTVPESLDLVDSGEPVVAVLEIAGGAAAREGIREGDRVHWNQPHG